MIALAFAGPTPGSVSSSSAVAVLRSTLPEGCAAVLAASVVAGLALATVTWSLNFSTVEAGTMLRDPKSLSDV